MAGVGRARPRNAADWLVFALVFFAALVWLGPFLFVAMTSIRGQGEMLSNGVFSIPTTFRLSNFAVAWNVGHFSTYFVNSSIVTATKVPIGVLIASLAAYPLAKMRFAGSTPIFVLFLIGLAIPIHVTLLPVFILLKNIGVLNTLFALYPPYVAFGLPFGIFVMRGFFRGIPTELIEAARLDGASELTIFARVMLPLAKPAVVTLFIIDGLNTWNEFLLALVLIQTDRWKTVPLGLLNFQGEYGSRYPELTAGILIAIAPILVVYLLFQRYLVGGLTTGAIKG